MSRKQQGNEEDDQDIVNKLFPNLFQRVHQEVLSNVEAQSFKSQKNIGKHEIPKVIEYPVQDVLEKRQNARLSCYKIRVLAAEVDDAMENIIEEHIQNSPFFKEVHEEILKCMNGKPRLMSPHHSLSKNCASDIKSEAEEDGYNFNKANPQGTAKKSLLPCEQKPNAKYASEDIMSPFSVKPKEVETMLMNRNSTKLHSVPIEVGHKKRKAS